MKIGICDNNQIEQKTIADYCKEIHETNLYYYSSGKELIKTGDPLDLLFLEIEMKELSGLQIKSIFEKTHKKTLIVFISSHIKFMPNAFGVNVIGFIRKPATKHEILRYLKRARYLLQNHCIIQLEDMVCNCNDIMYIESDHHYSNLHFQNGEHYLSRINLQEFTERLIHHQFYQIHRSYLINLRTLMKIKSASVILQDQTELPISRRNITHLKAAVQQYHLEEI